jgi:type I restriction-modification system DNA methylase subunit
LKKCFLHFDFTYIQKIKEKDYNLNISLYAQIKEKEEEIDLKEEFKKEVIL